MSHLLTEFAPALETQALWIIATLEATCLPILSPSTQRTTLPWLGRNGQLLLPKSWHQDSLTKLTDSKQQMMPDTATIVATSFCIPKHTNYSWLSYYMFPDNTCQPHTHPLRELPKSNTTLWTSSSNMATLTCPSFSQESITAKLRARKLSCSEGILSTPGLQL